MSFSIRRWLEHGLVMVIGLLLAWPVAVSFSIPALLLQGPCAVLLSRFRRHPWWASLLHLVALPLLWGALMLDIAPEWYLALATLTFAISGNAWRERVPLFLSTKATLSQLQYIVPPQARLIDLGCGTGTVLFGLARLRPDLILTGVENSMIPFLIARIRACFVRNVQVKFANLWQTSLQEADIVYCYLSPEPMPKVWQQFCQQAPAHGQLISNTFTIPGQPAQQSFPINDRIGSCLYVWQKPKDRA